MREENAAKIRQMEFVKMGEIEGTLHALKNMGQIDISQAKYQKILDVLPDGVTITKHGEFVHVSILK